MTARPINQRVDELRARRKALGLKRLELYVHPDDHQPIKLFADLLHHERQEKSGVIVGAFQDEAGRTVPYEVKYDQTRCAMVCSADLRGDGLLSPCGAAKTPALAVKRARRFWDSWWRQH